MSDYYFLINNFHRSCRAFGCDEDVHFASSCRKFRRELAMTSAFSSFFILEHCFKGYCDQSCLRGSMGKEQKRERERARGRERERERERGERE